MLSVSGLPSYLIGIVENMLFLHYFESGILFNLCFGTQMFHIYSLLL